MKNGEFEQCGFGGMLPMSREKHFEVVSWYGCITGYYLSRDKMVKYESLIQHL
jgi:hypothetical protein